MGGRGQQTPSPQVAPTPPSGLSQPICLEQDGEHTQLLLPEKARHGVPMEQDTEVSAWEANATANGPEQGAHREGPAGRGRPGPSAREAAS